jgi:hypothetical protein
MTPLYEQKWFCDFINWLRKKSPWFERWGWGYSVNMEDFVRNSFEEFKDNFFPFAVKNVNPISIFLLRTGYIGYNKDLEEEYYKETLTDNPLLTKDKIIGTYKPIPSEYLKRRIKIKIGKWVIFDLPIWNKWYTKFPNATFMLQLIICWKYYGIPLPWLSFVIRINKRKYIQVGLGYGPQWRNYNNRYPDDTSINAILSGKFRIGSYTKELEWNPGSEVYGFWEGGV